MIQLIVNSIAGLHGSSANEVVNNPCECLSAWGKEDNDNSILTQ